MPVMQKGYSGVLRCLAVLALLAGALGLGAGSAGAQNLSFNEFKFGVHDHDSHLLEGKEHGLDLNPEVIFQSPFSDAWVDANVPRYLQWMAQPRPTLGAQFNTSHYTNQFYFGPTWTWQLARGLLKPDDGIVFSFFFGPGFNDGMIQSSRGDWKALGSHVLFRESFELGYLVTPTVQLSVFVDHISNGGLAKENQSINDLGGRIGFRF